MLSIDLHNIQISTQTREAQIYVFDPVRKRWLVCTPEEEVRQRWIAYLYQMHHFPYSRMAVEQGFSWNGRRKRCDLILFNRQAQPILILECKKPAIALNSETAFQIAVYNLHWKVPFLLISNGLQHALFRVVGEQIDPCFNLNMVLAVP